LVFASYSRRLARAQGPFLLVCEMVRRVLTARLIRAIVSRESFL
jgi:hypothetical protein